MNKFDFDQVATALTKAGFNIDGLSRKYNIPPKLTKIYIRLILIWKSLICSKISLITCDRLIQKAYQFLKFEVSKNEISRQIGNLLGISIVASHFDKTEMSEELVYKIEHEFDKLAGFCVSKLDM